MPTVKVSFCLSKYEGYEEYEGELLEKFPLTPLKTFNKMIDMGQKEDSGLFFFAPHGAPAPFMP